MALAVDTNRWIAPGMVAVLGALIGLLAGLAPQLAIGAALGVAFVLLVIANLTAGLVIFTFLSFVALVPTAGGPALSFLKVAGLLLALSWLSLIAWRPRGGQVDFLSAYPGLTFLVVAFLGWAALSQVWAEDPGASVTDFTRYALNAILFLIVFSAVRNERDLVSVITAFVAGAVIAALYGLLVPPSDPSDAERLSGSIGNPNELAAVLVVGAVLGAGLAYGSRGSPLLRLAATAGAGFCMIGILFTLSRAGLVAMGFALLASVVLAGRWRARAAVVSVLVALAGVGYFTVVASTEDRERVSEAETGSGRLDLWTVGGRMVADNPVVGVGAGNFPVSSVHYLLEPGALTSSEFIADKPKVAHNTYLEVMAELGAVGLAMFVAILLACLGCGVRAARNFAAKGNFRMEVLARALLIALAGLLAAYFFGSEQFQKTLWLLLGLCPALLAISRAEQHQPADAGPFGAAAAHARH